MDLFHLISLIHELLNLKEYSFWTKTTSHWFYQYPKSFLSQLRALPYDNFGVTSCNPAKKKERKKNVQGNESLLE